mgnify:CR=1 FL=1
MAIDVDGEPLEWRHDDSGDEFRSKSLLIRRLETNGFSPEQIETILICVSRTCNSCWDCERYECYCSAHD